MKLSLLEDGVLDYNKNNTRVYATPNGISAASIGAGVKSASSDIHQKSKFERHIEDCPQCSKDNLCDVGRMLSKKL